MQLCIYFGHYNSTTRDMKAESVLFRNFERSYSWSLNCPCSPDDDRQRRYKLNKYGVNEKGS